MCPCIGKTHDPSRSLSRETVEQNLVELFQCLDREMRGFLTATGVQTLLRESEGVALSPTAAQALIDRFGSPVQTLDDDDLHSHGLSCDDLRDLYCSIAADDAKDMPSLVWDDLITVLGVSAADSIPIDAIAELVSCVTSDAPLVGLEPLATPLTA